MYTNWKTNLAVLVDGQAYICTHLYTDMYSHTHCTEDKSSNYIEVVTNLGELILGYS